MNQITFNVQNIPKKKAIVEEIFLYKSEKYFPDKKKVCKLHKKKTRTIKVINLANPTYIRYHIGQYKYFDETSNKWRYITERIPDVIGKRRHNNSTIMKAVEPVLRNEMTISYAAQQSRDLLNLTTVPSTIWRWIDVVDVSENAYQSMEEQIKKTFSGHLSVDEVYDNGDGIIIITDPVANTIISVNLIDGKPTDSDILSVFTEIKEQGFVPKSCTRDGSPLYMNTINKIFTVIMLQICIFHLIKNCLKYFSDWHREIRNELKTDELRRGLKGSGKSLKKYLFNKRYLFTKKDLTAKEQRIVSSIIEAVPEFGELRRLFKKFIKIFDSKTLYEAQRKLWDFLAEPLVGEKLKGVEKQLLKHYNKNELFTYLQFDQEIWTKIRTSNHTERVNRKFRKKQKTHYRIRKTSRRGKMLRLMVYFHNMKALGLGTNIFILLFFALIKSKASLTKKRNYLTKIAA